MNFGEKLKAARIECGLKQSELAKKLNTTGNTISNWENNVSKPDLETLSYICGILHVTPSYFLQPMLPEDEVSIPELKHIKKYRFVSRHSPDGAKMIDAILDREYSIAEQISEQNKQLSEQQNQINQLKQRIVMEIIHRIAVPLYGKFASAGSGAYLFDDIPTDMIEVEDTPIARKADFVMGVDGHSMEPDYYDGDKVFVKKTSELNVGDIGIFLKGENCYIKELGTDRLISHNPDKETYPDIQADEDIMIVGKVIGKVED